MDGRYRLGCVIRPHSTLWTMIKSLNFIPRKCWRSFSREMTSPDLPYRLLFMEELKSVSSGEEFACKCRRRKRHRFNPWVWKSPWRRAWQPAPLFLPGESHGQRTLAGYSPWGNKESNTTEHTCTPTHTREWIVTELETLNKNETQKDQGFMWQTKSSCATLTFINIK